MKRLAATLIGCVLATLALAPSASADFGLKDLDATFTGPAGEASMQAGSHPFATTTSFAVNTREEGGIAVIDGALRNLTISEPPGFVGDPTAVPRCSTLDFLSIEGGGSNCPASTSVGVISGIVEGGIGIPGPFGPLPVFNLIPSPGTVTKLGFVVAEVPVTINIVVNPQPPFNVIARVVNTPQTVELIESETTLWGKPADPAHDALRGDCALTGANDTCPVNIPAVPFITLPRSCTGPLVTGFAATSWWSGEPVHPGPSTSFEEAIESHDESLPPEPLGTTGCSKLGFDPAITAAPTSRAANSPSGLDFSLDVNNEGLMNPSEEAVADSDIEKTVVTLPQGFSINPSIAEGLAVCSEGQLERETAFSESGAGCPNASKIGTVEVETPLLEENVDGALYQATPYDNPFHNLITLYLVIKNPTLGIKVVQPLRVEPNPVTGQLTTVAEDMPQLPFSHFRLHFREGTRSPLVTPTACGRYDAHDAAHEPVRATLYPSSGGAPVDTSASFEVISGPGGGPCPNGGLPPFHPTLTAGTLNNAAGRFSPFNVRLSRTDSEQEITHFSIKLPPGIAAKLAGIPFCGDPQIAQAIARTGPHGGQEELNDPSCPAASQVGRTLAGSGVGPSLAYAPGKIYLAGPYHGSPISFVSITSGVVGPFDIGTVVVRLAIKVNPETGEVFLDSTGSDPIPHIIQGIPVHLRDIRAYTDRPEFTFNPTSCARTSTASTLLGAGLDFGSEADDRPVTITSPFQAADCAALPFKPKLSLKLIGGTKRGAHPALKAFLRMSGFGEAGIARAQVTLPKSEFIENAHFNTICTRVQFKEAGGNGESCPAGSIYGFARAKSPILADPLEGPVFLRSSEHQLPDLVASLRGQEINVHLVGHVDSVKGQLRNTFETVPDAPVEWASFSFQGGKKGLFVNSANLCKGAHKAKVEFTGHNGKAYDYGTALKVRCGKGRKKK